MAKNGYRALVKQRTKKGNGKPATKRRRLDDYETPENDAAIVYLCQEVAFRGAVHEPAAGSGRMARALRRLLKRPVSVADIKDGQDFLKRTKRIPANVITNPPYRDKLAELFCRKALELADGRVAMLVNTGFLSGARRANGLFAEFVPEKVIMIPHRILFHEGSGKQIESQFFSHCWLVWPSRATRKANASTAIVWISNTFEGE